MFLASFVVLFFAGFLGDVTVERVSPTTSLLFSLFYLSIIIPFPLVSFILVITSRLAGLLATTEKETTKT